MLRAPGRDRMMVRDHETDGEVRADRTVLPHVPLPMVEIDVTFLDRAGPLPDRPPRSRNSRSVRFVGVPQRQPHPRERSTFDDELLVVPRGCW